MPLDLSVSVLPGAGYRPDPDRLRRTAHRVFRNETQAFRRRARHRTVLVHLAFLPAADIRRLNRAWFGRRGDTDVITFNFDDPTPHGHFLGEILVSGPVLLRQARQAGHSPHDEADLLLIHGLLHLLGYDHTLPGAQGRLMTAKQDALFRRP